METAQHSTWRVRRGIDYYSYPWNYFVAGTGWPLEIGIFGIQSGNDILKGWPYDLFGASTRPGFMEGVPGHDDPAVLFPSSPPWSTGSKDHFLNPTAPLNGTVLNVDYFDPPEHYAFSGSSLPVTLDDMVWEGDGFNVVLWARGDGRYLYRGAGIYSVTFVSPIERIGADPRRSASVIPALSALGLLAGVLCMGSAAANAAGRRKRKKS